MKTSESGLKLIEQQEGFRSHVYADVADHLTIGFGHKLLAGESFPSGVTADQAQSLLAADVEWAERVVNGLVKVSMTQGQFDALVDFTFNVGSGTFAKSGVLALLNEGNPQGAVNVLSDYIYANHAVCVALVNRRKAEQALFDPAYATQEV